MKKGKTTSRKEEHVRITLSKDISFRRKTSGFERWDFVHNALPELNFADVSTECKFLNKRLSFPLIISSMTGGYKNAERINRYLAEVCAELQLGIGVGSQRQAMEDAKFHKSYSIVREISKEIPVFGNIGASEVACLKDISIVQELIELIEADGFAVHLNPLQELLQPEGNTDFNGVLRGIERLVRELKIPVIVKEIGAGISLKVAKQLCDIGVRIIDVAGAGGTSWAGMEIFRSSKSNKKSDASSVISSAFWDWGIPTVDCLREVSSLKHQIPALFIISSGGITNGLDIAKSIAFGADVCGSARPVLQTLERKGKKGVMDLMQSWKEILRKTMFLTGSRTIEELQRQQLRLI
jgi:isopentenyl-diphosphate delta-isomerase